MTAKTAVLTLISEQTIPNVQFLKWFFKNHLQTVDMIFISTKKMEEKRKSEDIINTIASLSQFFSAHSIIIVDENCLADIQTRIMSELQNKKYTKIIANITGGTKLMSLAVYEVCKSFAYAEIYYQPIDKSLQKIYPDYAEYDISELLTLYEYMTAHGVQYTADNYCVKEYSYNQHVYELLIKNNRELIKLLVELQNTPYFKNTFKKKKSINITAVEEDRLQTKQGEKIDKDAFCALLDVAGFDKTALKRRELAYLTGGWFEEYVYQKIKAQHGIQEQNIALNVEIEKGSDKNELDVVWLDAKNQLNVIECKSFLEGIENKVLNDALYKLQAIMKSKFGLRTASYLYTKSSLLEKRSALHRAEEFGIKIVCGEQV